MPFFWDIIRPHWVRGSLRFEGTLLLPNGILKTEICFWNNLCFSYCVISRFLVSFWTIDFISQKDKRQDEGSMQVIRNRQRTWEFFILRFGEKTLSICFCYAFSAREIRIALSQLLHDKLMSAWSLWNTFNSSVRGIVLIQVKVISYIRLDFNEM
jgi:hypothetical protein